MQCPSNSIHHPNILHGSAPNTSYNWRRGLTIRYIPATTSIEEDPWEAAFMLRGDPESDVNSYQPWPRVDEHDHIDFPGSDSYDERAAKMNERVADAGCLANKAETAEK